MAFHLLVNASENENSDPSVLNEVGIILMRLDRYCYTSSLNHLNLHVVEIFRLDESIKFFDIATKVICSNANNSSKMRNFPEVSMMNSIAQLVLFEYYIDILKLCVCTETI